MEKTMTKKKFESFDKSRDEKMATFFEVADLPKAIAELKLSAHEAMGGGFLPLGNNDNWPFFYFGEDARAAIEETAAFANRAGMATSKHWWDVIVPPLRELTETNSAYARLALEYSTAAKTVKLAVWFDLIKCYTLLSSVASTQRIVLMPQKPTPQMNWAEIGSRSVGMLFPDRFHMTTLIEALFALQGLTAKGKSHSINLKN
jgi:hypothetical protein